MAHGEAPFSRARDPGHTRAPLRERPANRFRRRPSVLTAPRVRPHARQVACRRRPHRCGGATLLPPFSGRESHNQIHVRRINRREKTDLRLCIRGSLRIRGRLGLRRRPNQGDRGWGAWSQPPRRGKDTRRTRPRALRGPHPASPCAWASPAAAAGPARRGPSAEASQAVNGERTAFPEPVGPRRLQFKIIRGPE